MSNNISDSLNYLGETKQIIRNAIVNKGEQVSEDEPFRNYAQHINNISGGGELPNLNIIVPDTYVFDKFSDERYIEFISENGGLLEITATRFYSYDGGNSYNTESCYISKVSEETNRYRIYISNCESDNDYIKLCVSCEGYNSYHKTIPLSRISHTDGLYVFYMCDNATNAALRGDITLDNITVVRDDGGIPNEVKIISTEDSGDKIYIIGESGYYTIYISYNEETIFETSFCIWENDRNESTIYIPFPRIRNRLYGLWRL